jgi:hypothetical protein
MMHYARPTRLASGLLQPRAVLSENSAPRPKGISHERIITAAAAPVSRRLV